MRKGYEGLYGLVRDRLQLEPLSGHVFIFCNKARNRTKVLFWGRQRLMDLRETITKRALQLAERGPRASAG